MRARSGTPLSVSTRSTARWIVVVAAIALVVAGTLAVVVTRSTTPGSTGAAEQGGGPSTIPSPTLTTFTAAQASTAFLSDYVDPDGRVVRRDQGGDTVSEGQAYAMLVAVSLQDRARFESVWTWTRTNLMRPDGTLSWRWSGGQVVDASSASDADLDTARALVLAGQTFDDPALTTAGVQLGKAVLDVETVTTGLGRILVAGSWATTEPYAYNPSYASPAAVAILAAASKDQRWAQLSTGTRAVTTKLLDAVDLPPDWAQVHHDGRIEAMPGAAGRGNDGVRYGYDATRMPLRFAESCDGADVALAARLETALARFGGNPASRDLGGQPLTGDESVVAISAQAAVLAATGNDTQALSELVAADHLQQQSPTYYGGAWDALGRIMLTTTDLGGCPPLVR